ncbi:MAG: Uma2 family endonuclease [Rhizobacter sp.]|nr:Uma2 family endonuclease [Chlorobiales bacterium]
MIVAPKLKMTAAEYLEFERASEVKHEFHDGEIFLMAGASRNHDVVTVNLQSELRQFFKGKPCRPHSDDIKISVGQNGKYLYPDISVICNEAAFIEPDVANDATVIIEVLSESTEAYNRGKKFQFYQSLPSLKEYVLVAQDEMKAEVFRKGNGGKWEYELIAEAVSLLKLPSIGFEIALSEIYDGVKFS